MGHTQPITHKLTLSVSLTRFKRLLTKARCDVRKLAHTLHIPPAQPEFYGGPQAGWLRDILDRLPQLQALIVSNLSFFDHQCIQGIQTSTKTPLRSPMKYHLRLLIASECENTTAYSLATALSQFPELMYLDISGAQGSRSPYVLNQIGNLTELRVLKLRKCGLRDEDLEYLQFSKNLRSLDVSHNLLTERGISKLLGLIPVDIMVPRTDLLSARDMSSGRRSSGINLHVRALPEDLENFVLKRLTSGVDGHIQVEDCLPSVFTNLSVASNYLTIDGLNRIIRHPTLRIMDCGLLNLSERSFELLSPRSPASSGSRRFSDPPEAEILNPALFCDSFRNLTSLRISHTIITGYPFLGKEIPISEQCFELHSEDLRFELDSKEVQIPGTLFEMEDTSKSITPEPEAEPKPEPPREVPESSPPPKAESEPELADKLDPETLGEDTTKEEEVHASFESPDDVAVQIQKALNTSNKREMNHINTLPSQINATNFTDPIDPISPLSPTEETPNLVRRVIPPRISVSSPHKNGLTSHPVYSGGSLPDGPEKFRYNYSAGTEAPWRALEQRPKPSGMRELIEEITQRQHRIGARERHPGRFKPSMLPNLKTLILTDVPSKTRRRHIIETLALFLQECAEEEELMRLEMLARHNAVNQKPCLEPTVKLHELMLEMTSKPEPIFAPRSPHRSPRHSFTKSSTEDPDSELFMNNSESDFSFFGEDDGGLLISEGRVDRPIMVDEGLMLDVDDGHLIDVISELANFRKEKRRRFETFQRLIRQGCNENLNVEIALLGHWRGEVKVVR
jgi:hypothetical protein